MARRPIFIVSQRTVSDCVAAYGSEAAVVTAALEIMTRRSVRPEKGINSPAAVRDYLRLLLSQQPREVFMGIFLDSQNRVIATEELFAGTLTQTSVYPREVVKMALHHNAGAVIFAHNHPSGVAEPSRSDEALTQALKSALALVDVRVLDHFVIGGAAIISFAERGLI